MEGAPQDKKPAAQGAEMSWSDSHAGTFTSYSIFQIGKMIMGSISTGISKCYLIHE